jgi:hypothetical protein
MIIHPISNCGLKAVRYNVDTETATAFTNNGTINDFNLTNCRIWSSPYEIIVRIRNNSSSKDDLKKVFFYEYIESNVITSSVMLNLNIGNEEIKLKGLSQSNDLSFANISNNINTRIIENNHNNETPLDLQGDFVSIYRERPLDQFKIDTHNHSDSINKILDDKSIIRT